MKRIDLEKLQSEVREILRIERLILQEKMEQEDFSSLRGLAEKGLPRTEYDYGLYFWACFYDIISANAWSEKCKKNANEHLVDKLSVVKWLMVGEYSQVRRG